MTRAGGRKPAGGGPGRPQPPALARVLSQFETLDRLLAQRQQAIERQLALTQEALAQAGYTTPEAIQAGYGAIDASERAALLRQVPGITPPPGAPAQGRGRGRGRRLLRPTI